MFNTSRGTLREALRVLEERGLIEIKLGVHGGAIVRGVNADQVTRTLARMIRSQQVSLNHLAEFREGVEGNAASLAAQHATPEDIQRLQNLVEEARGHVFQEPPDRNAFIEVDKRFHQELAIIGGNPVYIFIMETIHENIHRYYDRYLSMKRHELEENFGDLRDITQAVAAHKADEARVLAQSHVLRFNRRMAAREAQDQV
jgi:DNA-binding FadR family transcriptional regulator